MKRDVQASAQPPTKVMHRQLHRLPPIATGGRGAWITDAEGKRYLDASGGAAVSCLGHGHPDVLAAMRAQMDAIAYAHTSFFTTDVAETLADTLVASAPRGIDHVYFVSGVRRRSRPRLNSHVSISLKPARRSGVISSRGVKAITATRSARSRSAATPGGARNSRRS